RRLRGLGGRAASLRRGQHPHRVVRLFDGRLRRVPARCPQSRPFGRVLTAVGLPGYQGWAPPAPPEPGGQVSNTNPLLDNLRWTPIMQWAQAVDELNPYPGARAQQDRLKALGYRSRFWTFTSGEHFLLSVEDE